MHVRDSRLVSLDVCSEPHAQAPSDFQHGATMPSNLCYIQDGSRLCDILDVQADVLVRYRFGLLSDIAHGR